MSLRWEDLGVDDGGLPVHLPIGVNAAGQGPESDAKAHHFACWCGDAECLLTRILAEADARARADEQERIAQDVMALSEQYPDAFGPMLDKADVMDEIRGRLHVSRRGRQP